MEEKLFPDPVLKNQNWADLWMTSLMFYTIHFYCISKSKTTKIYWSEGSNHFLLVHIKVSFLKMRTGIPVSQAFLSSMFPTGPKHQDKNLNNLRTKKAFKMKWALFKIWKGLSLKQIKPIFWKVRFWLKS